MRLIACLGVPRSTEKCEFGRRQVEVLAVPLGCLALEISVNAPNISSFQSLDEEPDPGTFHDWIETEQFNQSGKL
ncbi:hypothetical protein [Oryzicola mucosus]|uniref:Uncharacterized protein n=1 Tax=Oryzicola mucosus TaxID=2767425 RepID=A0A8J6PP89_9HYPH|nr:hypothetical protein [Oryzicola mucosus]MBD0415230.1 hypothetical protein [Oryzicola mucosus]